MFELNIIKKIVMNGFYEMNTLFIGLNEGSWDLSLLDDDIDHWDYPCIRCIIP
jgi:hypothetical protein